MRPDIDFDKAPLLVIWEVTRACELACRHCRAEAIPGRHPQELTLEEGKELLDQVAEMGTPLFVFTGGDPLQRDDLEELIAHGKSKGLRVATIPAATARLTHDRVRALKEAGLDQMALSLDGSTAAAHDDFRQVPGSFARTMEAAAWARIEKLPLQFNTVLGPWNYHDFEALAEMVESFRAVFWEVFFLVPTGRGAELPNGGPEEYERLFEKLFAVARHGRFHLKVTEAPHYRRHVLQHAELLGEREPSSNGHPIRPEELSPGLRRFTGLGVNAGKGYCFVDHLGSVYPSGFLPLPAGNLRYYPLASIYRESALFRELREPDRLGGQCGHCTYRMICGGSRSRAFAVTGDYLAEEPGCLLTAPPSR